jgi:hypothetical protein
MFSTVFGWAVAAALPLLPNPEASMTFLEVH